MKTLLLMRHAKSSWKEHDLPDRERPLNKRGHRDAPVMGQLIVDRELVPQRILSSSALRARQTAEIVAESSGFTGEVTYLDSLYMGEVEDYLLALRALPDTIERVMIIGHNPSMEELLQRLSRRIESLPTAVLAHLVLPISHWSELTADTEGDLLDIWRPKELRELAEDEGEEEKEKDKGKGKKEKEKEKPKEKARSKGKKK